MYDEKPTSEYSKQLEKSSPDTTTIRAILIGEKSSLKGLQTQLKNHPEIVIESEEESGMSALDLIDDVKPEIIFVHQNLYGIDAFELISKIRLYPQPVVIYISDSDISAARAFEYQVLDYLVDPFPPERLFLSIVRIKEQLNLRKRDQLQRKLNALFRYIKFQDQPASKHNRNDERKIEDSLFPVKLSGKICFLKINEIEYICASGYYVEIYTGDKKHLVRQSLRSIQDKLNQDFFIRIHRSMIINLLFLEEINRQGLSDFTVKLKDGSEFKISKTYRKAFFERFDI